MRLNGYERLITLRELYEEGSHIANLDDHERPWALVADSDTDGLRQLWGLESRIREFKLYEITKHYGYNLTEFLHLPRHLVEFILEEQRDEESRARKARDKAEREAKHNTKSPIDIDPRGFGGFNFGGRS